ncbi:bromodomain-containing protein 4A [Drosophila eugracilis]|uniref:bromodomain-containing protein 4A n=1 Tax=Drosophila eugracilis TaxID=29029 RepID=UPI0007E65525|nr:bromodomain-containing protein 4A [Drosophila eugracilis]
MAGPLSTIPTESDSDVEIIESEPMDRHNHLPNYRSQLEHFKFPNKMHPQIPAGMPSPPFSPTDPMEMPLLKELLARKEHANVPEGFVLCIPCYLCRQPFDNIETFKEHLTQHAADIHAWNTSRAQAQEPAPMIKPFVHPINQAFVHSTEQPLFIPIEQVIACSQNRPFNMPMGLIHQPPLDMYSPPLEPPMSFQMPLVQHQHQIQPQMQFPIQHTLREPQPKFPGPQPILFPRKLTMPLPYPQEIPVPPSLGCVQNKPQLPPETQSFMAPTEPPSISVKEMPVLVRPISHSPEKDPIEIPEKPRSPVMIKPKPVTRGQFECDWCGKRLSSRQALRYHESHFHAEEQVVLKRNGKDTQKQHKCPTCKKRYKRRTFLLMHMKVKHGIVCPSKSVPDPESPNDADVSPLSPEVSVSPKSLPDKESRKEIWSTRIYNAVAAAKYRPASEKADKYMNTPRQQKEQMVSGFATTTKRTYPLRSPFFNPDLWLDCNDYL